MESFSIKAPPTQGERKALKSNDKVKAKTKKSLTIKIYYKLRNIKHQQVQQRQMSISIARPIILKSQEEKLEIEKETETNETN